MITLFSSQEISCSVFPSKVMETKGAFVGGIFCVFRKNETFVVAPAEIEHLRD